MPERQPDALPPSPDARDRMQRIAWWLATVTLVLPVARLAHRLNRWSDSQTGDSPMTSPDAREAALWAALSIPIHHAPVDEETLCFKSDQAAREGVCDVASHWTPYYLSDQCWQPVREKIAALTAFAARMTQVSSEVAPFSAGRWTHDPSGECFDASVLNGLVQHYIETFAAQSARRPRDADALAEALRHYVDECHFCRGSGYWRVKKGGQGLRNTDENFIESQCPVCETARVALGIPLWERKEQP